MEICSAQLQGQTVVSEWRLQFASGVRNRRGATETAPDSSDERLILPTVPLRPCLGLLLRVSDDFFRRSSANLRRAARLRIVLRRQSLRQTGFVDFDAVAHRGSRFMDSRHHM